MRHASRLGSSSTLSKQAEARPNHARVDSSGLALPPLTTISAAGELSPALGRDSSPDSARKSRKNSSKKGSNASQTPSTADMYLLDTDLSHMEGIVNPTYSVPLTAASLDSRASAWSESMSSSGTRPNGSEGSSNGMPFTNPFNSGSHSPDAARANGGGHPFPATLPRRPSHLRTMATPSEEGGNPFDMLPPPILGSGSRPPNDGTTFSNPFASAGKGMTPNSRNSHLKLNLNGLDPASQSPLSTPKGPGALAQAAEPPAVLAAAVSGAPPIRPQEKAWIAPESWGVEGDLPDEEHESSSEDAEDPSLELLDTLNQGGMRSLRPPGTPGIEAEDFNWASPGTDSASLASRPMTGGSIAGRSMRQSTVSMGRSSTAGGNNRPGTGGWSKVGSASAASSLPVSRPPAGSERASRS